MRQNGTQRNPETKQKSFSLQDQPEIKRANSSDFAAGKKMVELENIGTYRYNSKGNLEAASKGNPYYMQAGSLSWQAMAIIS